MSVQRVNQPISCSVCLNPLLAAEKLNEKYEVSSVPHDIVCSRVCFHVFHRHCVAPWIERHPNCPNCRKELMDVKLIDFGDFRDVYTRYLNNEISENELRPSYIPDELPLWAVLLNERIREDFARRPAPPPVERKVNRGPIPLWPDPEVELNRYLQEREIEQQRNREETNRAANQLALCLCSCLLLYEVNKFLKKEKAITLEQIKIQDKEKRDLIACVCALFAAFFIVSIK